ncbi:MAG TPA: DMT family transporter [Gemmatimonadaceae bacterium]|nr:DMT family transporter [Gemmatimonadaceae bacterium]
MRPARPDPRTSDPAAPAGPPAVKPGLVLAVALVGISFAAPLVRLSDAHPLAISIWRLAFSLVVIGVALIAGGGWRQWTRLDRPSLAIALGAGALLAVHFWAWNASIGMTSIAASVVLVNLHPVVVAAVSAVWLGERPTPRQWVGIVLALAGAVVIATGDVGGANAGTSARALLGDVLAVVGAVTVALYYVGGRRLRQTLDLWPYVGLVYGSCLLVLLGFATALGVPFATQPPRELAIFAALALGPMLLGHTGMNYALRYLPAYVVALTVLGEPVGATLLGAFLPGIREVPGPRTLVGAVIILAGVVATARTKR